MRRAWDRGKASGIAGPLDMKAIILEAKAEVLAPPTSDRDRDYGSREAREDFKGIGRYIA